VLVQRHFDTGPKYIKNFFSARETLNNLRGTGVNFCLPNFDLKYMKNSLATRVFGSGIHCLQW